MKPTFGKRVHSTSETSNNTWEIFLLIYKNKCFQPNQLWKGHIYIYILQHKNHNFNPNLKICCCRKIHLRKQYCDKEFCYAKWRFNVKKTRNYHGCTVGYLNFVYQNMLIYLEITLIKYENINVIFFRKKAAMEAWFTANTVY